MAFHHAYSRPTAEQFAIIGEIITDAAVIDLLVCNIVSRLAGVGEFPGLAIMERMSLLERVKAAQRLLDLHHRRYRFQVLPETTVTQGIDIFRRLEKLREMRNDAAHSILFRATDDGVFAFKPSGRQARYPEPDKPADRITGMVSKTDLRRLATKLAGLAEELEVFRVLLPEVPEVPAK